MNVYNTLICVAGPHRHGNLPTMIAYPLGGCHADYILGLYMGIHVVDVKTPGSYRNK